MKAILIVLSLMICSCSPKKNKEEKSETTKITTEQKKSVTAEVPEVSAFEKKQDSLRTLILTSKSNANLRSSVLEELYIRGLVNQVGDKIIFQLPFNLHSPDCGAPDCYTTNISFEIPYEEPIKFPKTIDFKLREYGCDIKIEIESKGVFELIELSAEYLNYYSKTHRSNLIILGTQRKLYYFPETEPNTVQIGTLDQLLDTIYKDENIESPYQSFLMTTNEHENFITNK